MQHRVTPRVAPLSEPWPNDDGLETTARGLAVLNSPLLNKGTAFTGDERTSLGLVGLLPPEISTLEMQVKRAYIQYELLSDSLSKNIYLTALHDRNEVLFYRLFSEHLREMIPIVNDLTARDRQVQWIRYESVRDTGGFCAVVLDVDALTVAEPMPQQTWHCKTTRQTVLMVHGQDRYSWDF